MSLPAHHAGLPATGAQLAALTWNQPGDPTLWHALVAAYGQTKAADMWHQAAVLLERHAPRTCSVGPTVRPVLTVADIDHDSVPDQPATVCGEALTAVPDPSDLTQPQGTPCPECLGANQ